MILPDRFVSCDWGTSSFRLRLVDTRSAHVIREVIDARGVKVLSEAGTENAEQDRRLRFERYFRKKLGELGADPAARPGLPILISGMASSSLGWKELPYARTPFEVDGSHCRIEPLRGHLNDEELPTIWLISGVRTDTDIMRGEETEVIGLFTQSRYACYRDRCVVVLPGSHSKHVYVNQGHIEAFHTWMTGELFEILAHHSVLRSSVSWPAAEPALSHPSGPLPEHRFSFRSGFQFARANGFGEGVFRVRTRDVLDGRPPRSNAWFLLGILLGSEIQRLVERYPDEMILLSGGRSFTLLYEMAIEMAGARDRTICVEPELSRHAPVFGHRRLLQHLTDRPRS